MCHLQVLVLVWCSDAWSLAMHETPPWSSKFSRMLSWVLHFQKQWACSVWWLPSWCCLHFNFFFGKIYVQCILPSCVDYFFTCHFFFIWAILKFWLQFYDLRRLVTGETASYIYVVRTEIMLIIKYPFFNNDTFISIVDL